MKEFKCGAVVPGCPTVFHAESEAALFEQIGAHARDVHGLHEVPPEVVDEIRANISEPGHGTSPGA